MPEPTTDAARSRALAAQAVAQQAATAAIHRDWDSVRDIVREYPVPESLAFTLLGLLVRTHTHWANVYGLGDDGRKEAWAEIVGDLEVWRSEKETQGRREQ